MILVTGGLGYIGSHACVALAAAGHRIVVLDNLCNSKLPVLERLGELTGREIGFVQGDVRDPEVLDRVFENRDIESVLHFAGLKSVADSVARPSEYRDNNVGGTRTLLDAMRRHGAPSIVFSSSATVYGAPDFLPYTEDHPLRPASPYGEHKLEIERLLAASGLLHASLRYFNPIGAHPSGRIGEDPRGVPDNLLPYLTQVAVGRLPKLRIYGSDYPTADGTGVRDYLHVMDLAAGHVAAMRYLREKNRSLTANLGAGRGYSVLEVLKAFERANAVAIPYEFAPRRAGDIAAYWADPAHAARELGWRTALGMEDMCRDAWRWQSQNPGGYPDL